MKKILSLLMASSFAFYMQACSDNATSAEDDEIDLVSSSSVDKAKSSSSKAKSSSSKGKSSSSSVKSSSSSAKSSSSKETSSSSSADEGSVYVYFSDWTSPAGELRWVKDGKISDDTLQFSQDTKIVGVDDNIFVVESGKGALALVDPAKNKPKWQVKLGDGTNPSDVVKANDKEVWVALKDAAKFVKVAIKDGKVTKTVKTENLVHTEGHAPHLADFEVRNDTLFAMFQRYVSEGMVTSYDVPGLIAMYNLDDGEFLDTIRLAKKNPAAMGFANGELYVGSTGDYSGESDVFGIEVVDVAKKKSSVLIDGEKFGTLSSGLVSFVVDAEGYAYGTAYKDYNGNVPLFKIDLSKKSVKTVSGVSDVEGTLFFDNASGTLYIGERGENAGVYVYKNDKVSKLKSPKDVLPVNSITVVR